MAEQSIGQNSQHDQRSQFQITLTPPKRDCKPAKLQLGPSTGPSSALLDTVLTPQHRPRDVDPILRKLHSAEGATPEDQSHPVSTGRGTAESKGSSPSRGILSALQLKSLNTVGSRLPALASTRAQRGGVGASRVASIMDRMPRFDPKKKASPRWVHNHNGPAPADGTGRSLQLENTGMINAIHGTAGRREFVKLPELCNRQKFYRQRIWEKDELRQDILLLQQSDSGSAQPPEERSGVAEWLTARDDPVDKIIVVDSVVDEPSGATSRPLFSNAKVGASAQLGPPRYQSSTKSALEEALGVRTYGRYKQHQLEQHRLDKAAGGLRTESTSPASCKNEARRAGAPSLRLPRIGSKELPDIVAASSESVNLGPAADSPRTRLRRYVSSQDSQPFTPVQANKKAVSLSIRPFAPPKRARNLTSIDAGHGLAASAAVEGGLSPLAPHEKGLPFCKKRRSKGPKGKKPTAALPGAGSPDSDELLVRQTFYVTQYLKLIRERELIGQGVQDETRPNFSRQLHLDSLMGQLREIERQLDDLESEASLSLWGESKTKFGLRGLLRDLVGETKDGSELRRTFMQGLLVPDKLENDSQRKLELNVVHALRASLSPASEADPPKPSNAKLARHGTHIMRDKQQPMLRGSDRPALARQLTVARPAQSKKELGVDANAARIGNRYLDNLVQQHDRSTFLLRDIKEVNEPRYQEESKDAKREFARHCYNKRAVPRPSLVVQNQIKEGLYALTNAILSTEQSQALANTFKCMFTAAKEFCFSNNNLGDKQFADILTQMCGDQDLLEDLQGISYSHNNELGQKTLSALVRLIRDKPVGCPLTHLCLAGCKQRSGLSIQPVIAAVHGAGSQLQTLVIPQLNLGEDGFSTLCGMLRSRTALRNLDISWNRFAAGQVKELFRALAQNGQLESVNLAMTAVSPKQNLSALQCFLRKNRRLLHADLSGMVHTVEQVRRIIKSIKKAEALLALHISHTPIISSSRQLQAYIRTKLRMGQISRRPRNRPQAGDNELLRERLRGDWVERDALQAECHQEERVTEYYNSQRSLDTADDGKLVIQRAIGHPYLPGNQKWVGSQDCYVCQRWRITCFCYQPEARSAYGFGGAGGGPASQSREQYTLGGSFESLTMGSSGTPWTGFEMLDKDSFVAMNECTYLSAHLMSGFNRVPDRPNPAGEGEEEKDWLLFADFVKPTGRVEVMKVTSPNAPPFMAPFVPKTRMADFRVTKALAEADEGVKAEVVRPFSKEHSVFAPWKEDTAATLAACWAQDFQHWKAPRVCKDPEDLENVMALVREHYAALKHIFYSLIACKEYPRVGWMNFGLFAEQVAVVDAAHHVSLETVDRAFIATNYDVEHTEGNPEKQLCRYEFLEILVRLAGEKYRRSEGEITTYAGALETFLQNEVLRHSRPPPWQGFRDRELWTTEVNNVIGANLACINEVHRRLTHFQDDAAGLRSFHAVLDMIMHGTAVDLHEKEAHSCFAMSKMTLVHDVGEGHTGYYKMKVVEFYEFLGRAAAARYADNSPDSLGTKIEKLLDLILPHYGMARVVVGEGIETGSALSESEDSVDIDELDPSITLMEDDDDSDLRLQMD